MLSSGLTAKQNRTPDRIAAELLLDRAYLLERAGHVEGADQLRQRAGRLTDGADAAQVAVVDSRPESDVPAHTR